MNTKQKRQDMYYTILEWLRYHPLMSAEEKHAIQSFIITLIEAENKDRYNYFIEKFTEITNKRKEELNDPEEQDES